MSSINTMGKVALGWLGWLQPRPAQGKAARQLPLPAPRREGGLPLMQALDRRQSQRQFSSRTLSMQQFGELLWVAGGINRIGSGGRTVPSAMNVHDVDVYAALPEGLYRYQPKQHVLQLVVASDLRRITGYQDFVDRAPVNLIYVGDHRRMRMVPSRQRVAYANAVAGAMAQNVYLYCASEGLSTVVRAWVDRPSLAAVIGLLHDEHVLLAQTVGYPPDRHPGQPGLF